MMNDRIKSAAEVIASTQKLQRQLKKERVKFTIAQLAERDRLEAYGDLRDDVMSLVKNSGMSFEEIHGRCGPHPLTLEKWARQETKFPQLGKMRSTLRIIGYDFGIVDKRN
jgi:hypothetical protein